MKNRLLLVGLLGLGLWGLSPLVSRGESTTRSEHSLVQESLALPSFSIFFAPPQDKTLDRPYSAEELKKFLDSIEKQPAELKKMKVSEAKARGYWIIPMVFYRSRHLFVDKAWTEEDRAEGKRISGFFARLARKPELEIEATDTESFRKGLLRLKNWFAGMCRDNKMLVSMIFTLDDGPFFGGAVDKKQLAKTKRVASIPVGGKGAKLVLMNDGKKPEPMILGVLKPDGSLLWAKRYSGQPVGNISGAKLLPQGTKTLQGYGYKCGIAAEWTYGSEYSGIYLDEGLNLRFYFVSW